MAFIRYLNIKHPELFNISEVELRTCIPKDLPHIFKINKWHHRNYYASQQDPIVDEDEKPSSYETFPMIAKILVTKDTSLWNPKLKPNNEWNNWISEY
jgi:hypothetical protein